MLEQVINFSQTTKLVIVQVKSQAENLTQLIAQSSLVDNKNVDHPRNFESQNELKQFYDNFGYVSVKNLIPEDLIQKVREDLKSVFEPYSVSKENPIDSAIIALDREDKPKLYELHSASSKMLSLRSVALILSDFLSNISHSSKPVFEKSCGWLLGIPQDTRLTYDFHQESNYMKDAGDIFNFHYPLCRTSTTQNGTMSILPSSHLYGTLDFEKKRVSQDSYTNLVPKDIEKISQEIPELHCQLDVGDCVVFHKNLIHKSNFNSSELCRPVGIARLTQSLDGEWTNRKPEDL